MLRRRGLMGVAKGRLPSAYQEVTYLYATQSARFNPEYFNLGAIFQRGSSAKVTIVGNRPKSVAYLFGNSKFYKYSPSSVPYIKLGDSNQFSFTVVATRENIEVTWTFEVDDVAKTAKLTSDNGTDRRVVNATYTGSIMSSDDVYLMWTNGLQSVGYGEKGYLYSAVFELDGVVVRDLVPCYRKADHKAGMYDLIGNHFYTNANPNSPEDFIIGEVI